MMMETTFLYEFLRGPMAVLATTIFLAGAFYRLIRFWLASRPIRSFQYRMVARAPRVSSSAPARLGLAFAWARFRQTAWGRMPVMSAVTTLFHAGLLTAVAFQLGHNVLVDQSWGVSLPCFPEAVTDALTVWVLSACAFFAARRLFVAQVRALTSTYDVAILGMVALPFLTGMLAYHHIFDYDTMILLHMASGELVLVAVPFTKLMHAFYFIIHRFLLAGEHSFVKRGARAW